MDFGFCLGFGNRCKEVISQIEVLYLEAIAAGNTLTVVFNEPPLGSTVNGLIITRHDASIMDNITNSQIIGNTMVYTFDITWNAGNSLWWDYIYAGGNITGADSGSILPQGGTNIVIA